MILVQTDIYWVSPIVALFLASRLGNDFFCWFVDETKQLADQGHTKYD